MMVKDVQSPAIKSIKYLIYIQILAIIILNTVIAFLINLSFSSFEQSFDKLGFHTRFINPLFEISMMSMETAVLETSLYEN